MKSSFPTRKVAASLVLLVGTPPAWNSTASAQSAPAVNAPEAPAAAPTAGALDAANAQAMPGASLADIRNRADAGAEPLSLIDAIALALRNNPQRGAALAGLEAGRARIGTARAAGGVQVGLSGNANANRNFGGGGSGSFGGNPGGNNGGNPGDGTGGNFSGGGNSATSETIALAASVPLFTGGRVKASTRVAQFNAQAQALQVLQVEQDLVLNTTLSYLNILRAQQLLDVTENNLRVSRERLRVSNVRFEAGVSARLDVLRAETDLADAQQRRITANNALGQSKGNLNVLMGRSPNTPLRIDSITTLTPRISLSAALTPTALSTGSSGAGLSLPSSGNGTAGTTPGGTASGATSSGSTPGLNIPGTLGSGTPTTATPGTFGNGTLGNGTLGSGTLGSGTLGSGTLGSGTLGSGTPGNGTPGNGTSGATGSGGGNAAGVAPGTVIPNIIVPGIVLPGTAPSVLALSAPTIGTAPSTPGGAAPGGAASIPGAGPGIGTSPGLAAGAAPNLALPGTAAGAPSSAGTTPGITIPNVAVPNTVSPVTIPTVVVPSAQAPIFSTGAPGTGAPGTGTLGASSGAAQPGTLSAATGIGGNAGAPGTGIGTSGGGASSGAGASAGIGAGSGIGGAGASSGIGTSAASGTFGGSNIGGAGGVGTGSGIGSSAGTTAAAAALSGAGGGTGAAGTFAQLQATAGQSRSSLAVTEAQLRAAEAAIELAKSQRRPSVGLNLAGLLRNPASFLGRFALSLGLGLTQGLFDSGRSRSQIDEARAIVKQLRQNLSGQKLAVANQIDQSLLTLDSAQQRLSSVDTAVTAASEAVRAAQLGYEAGARTAIEVSDAQAALLTTQTEAVNARFDLANAQAQLSAAVGVLAVEQEAGYQRALGRSTNQAAQDALQTLPEPRPRKKRKKILGIF